MAARTRRKAQEKFDDESLAAKLLFGWFLSVIRICVAVRVASVCARLSSKLLLIIQVCRRQPATICRLPRRSRALRPSADSRLLSVRVSSWL